MVNDITVDKQQAFIKYDSALKEITVCDNSSNHGTFQLIQRPIELKFKEPIYVLNQFTFLKVEVDKQIKSLWSSIKSCCLSPQKDLKYLHKKKGGLYQDIKTMMPSDLCELDFEM